MTENLKTKRASRRTSVNGVRNILSVTGKDPAYHYRFVNDEGDRIKDFEEIGYEIVRDSSMKVGDRRISAPASDGAPVQTHVGGGVKGYLMRIKKEWYEEDQAAKHQRVAELEAGMKQEARSAADYGKLNIS